MFEQRCPKCHNLLFKEDIRDGRVEIKCPHCNQMITIDRIIRVEERGRRLDDKTVFK